MYSGYSELTVFLSFCSFCYREQNERNDFPFITKTELLPSEHKYRLFRVFLFRNIPKRTRPQLLNFQLSDWLTAYGLTASKPAFSLKGNWTHVKCRGVYILLSRSQFFSQKWQKISNNSRSWELDKKNYPTHACRT